MTPIGAVRAHEPNWLLRAARARPNHTAWQIDGVEETYAEVARSTALLAGQLLRAGLERGQRLAVVSSDPGCIGRLLHATTGLECPLVVLHPRLRASELAPLLERTEPRLLVHTHAQRDVAQATRLPESTTLWDFEQLRALEARAEELAEQLDPAADRTILFTSGTTGRPKAVRLGLAQHGASASANQICLDLTQHDRWLLCMPPYHIGGLAILLRSARLASKVVLHHRFEAADVEREIAEGGITHVSMVPTMLGRLLALTGAGNAPASLRCVLLGGGPIPTELLERARAGGWPLACTYGLTEAASSVATGVPGQSSDLPHWLPPLPDTELRVVSESGAPLPTHTVGEIQVRGPQVMSGYLDDPEGTRRAFDGAWLRTGDLGELDDAGRLRVHARRSDLIVSGGENVYPAEVEAVLDMHPRVVETAVTAIPDPEWGQRAVAWILADPTPADRKAEGELAHELELHCRAHLAAFKCPSEFVFRREPLPRTASGKLRRTELRIQVKP